MKKWHFQYPPHDVNDWDSTQPPIIADGMFKGQRRKLVEMANRNGSYYSLDRTSAKFIAGRPMRLQDIFPTVEGKLLYPSLGGGQRPYKGEESFWAMRALDMATGDFVLAMTGASFSRRLDRVAPSTSCLR